MIAPSTLLRCGRVLMAWRRGQRIPLSVTYFVNESCNLRCRGCFFFEYPHEADRGQAELSPEEALELVDDIADLGVPFLELVGGEPFLRPDLLAIGERARERGLWCGVTTNGTRLTPQLAREARRVFRTVFVSIDGEAEAHDAVRGAGTFVKIDEGLTHLLEAPGAALIGVSTIASPENVRTLGRFATQLQARGVEQLVVSGPIAPAPKPSAKHMLEAIAELLELKRRHPSFLPQDDAYFDALGRFHETGERYGCDVDQLLHVSITPAGETSACCNWPVPLGRGSGGQLRQSLTATAPNAFDPVPQCPGCVRHDYGFTMRLFERPWPSLIATGLKAALGPTLRQRAA